MKGKPISPIALEAVKRIDGLFVIERGINGFSAVERLAGPIGLQPSFVMMLKRWRFREL